MMYRKSTENDRYAIVQLFTSVFADSEGKSEGAVIGHLANDLFDKTDAGDLLNFVAESNSQIAGSVFFSRLIIEKCTTAFLMAPVAVRSDQQGNGIGQNLIRYSLEALRDANVSFVATYGDPAFYGKVGFEALSQHAITAPYELSQPEGWLGQSLSGDSLKALSGRCVCVEAFREPSYW